MNNDPHPQNERVLDWLRIAGLCFAPVLIVGWLFLCSLALAYLYLTGATVPWVYSSVIAIAGIGLHKLTIPLKWLYGTRAIGPLVNSGNDTDNLKR